MRSLGSHLGSFALEILVAVLAGWSMYGMLCVAGILIGMDREVASGLSLAFVFPLGFLVVSLKSVFPRMVPHRSYSLIGYITLSQALAATFTAVILEAMGERWAETGNLRDIVFYGLALGTPYGAIYAVFSKIFSKDVDTSVVYR